MKMLLETGVMVVESIRLSPMWPRFEFRSDAIRLSLFFSASRPCSCSLLRLLVPALRVLRHSPLHKITISSMKNSRRKKTMWGCFATRSLSIYLFTRKVHSFKLLHTLSQRRSPSGTRQFWACSPSWMQLNRSMRRAVRSFQREKQK